MSTLIGEVPLALSAFEVPPSETLLDFAALSSVLAEKMFRELLENGEADPRPAAVLLQTDGKTLGGDLSAILTMGPEVAMKVFVPMLIQSQHARRVSVILPVSFGESTPNGVVAIATLGADEPSEVWFSPMIVAEGHSPALGEWLRLDELPPILASLGSAFHP